MERMTLSPRLTQERLAELLREVDALHDGLAPLTPEQKAAWLLPHLGAQEAPRPMTDTLRALQEALQRYDTMPDADDPWVAAARGQEVADAVRDYLRAPPRFDTTCSMVTGIPDPPLPSSAGSSAVPPSQSRDVIGWLVLAAEALALVADDEVAGLPQRLRSHGHLNARDREALKRTKEMCDAVLRATAVVREQIGASSPPAVSGPPLCKNCRVEIRPGEPHISIDNQGDFCSGECLRSDDAKIRGGPR